VQRSVEGLTLSCRWRSGVRGMHHS